eukprot:scaffold1766_cov401-Prasinococcus_capsulatus_cf.AAC.15
MSGCAQYLRSEAETCHGPIMCRRTVASIHTIQLIEDTQGSTSPDVPNPNPAVSTPTAQPQRTDCRPGQH